MCVKLGSIKTPLGAVNIVMEFCAKGSLQDCLDGIQTSMKTSGNEPSFDEMNQLHTWALQVAKGMEFIASQNVIIFLPFMFTFYSKWHYHFS